jgi:uncharacterized membrane protein (UPF0127 family)
MRFLPLRRLVLGLVILAPLAAARGAASTEQMVVRSAKAPVTFVVEVASTPDERQRGLMFRDSLAPLHGMLFDLGTVQPVSMWMKDTKIPLDMLFIDGTGRITRIAADTVPMSEAIIPSEEPVRAVLEIGGGESARLGIRVGDRVQDSRFQGE